MVSEYKVPHPFPGAREVEFTLSMPNPPTRLPGLNTTSGNLTPSFAPGILIGKVIDSSYAVGVELSETTVLLSPDAHKSRIRRGEIFFGNNDGRTLPRISFPYFYGSCKIKVRTDSGYFEVYTDDQFLFRLHTSELTEPASGFAIQNNNGVKGTGAMSFSDITVKKWAGAPAANANPEQLLRHYQAAYDLNPDDRWSQFWLGQAKHANNDLDGALELYQQAYSNGVNAQIAGFYIGDIFDRKGDHKLAYKWYRKSVTETQDGLRRTVPHFTPKSTPYQWACFRANWLCALHGFEMDNKEDVAEMKIGTRLQPKLNWLENCLKAVIEDDADKRISRLEDVIKSTPRDYRDIPRLILKELKADGKVSIKQDAPEYLQVDGITPFFAEGEINL